jgi:DNA-binding NarL/FixJ family response regulator
MKAVAVMKKPRMNVALVESDPLRLVGFRSLFDSQAEIEVSPVTLAEIANRDNIDVALLGSRNDGRNLFDMIAGLKAARPGLRILVTGTTSDDETILKALAAGAKGYVDEGATSDEFVQALKVVHQGSVWAPRRVLSMFVDRVAASGRIFPAGRLTFTDREKEVLELLVAGRSNKEIGASLGIEERTVKAHVAKLMRKVGVQNRIALSVHAITHSLVQKG